MCSMTDKARKTNDFDVLIIGAGPAGISAGIWCADLGLRTAIFEKEPEAGGQLLSIYGRIENYPGLFVANGRELRDRFLTNSERFGAMPILSTEIVDFDPEAGTITDKAGNRFSARYFIFATGVRRRKLGIPGEESFVGKGVIRSGTRDHKLARDKIVAIIGGGDAALENALILAESAKKVFVIYRRDAPTARKAFVDQAKANSRIEFVPETAAVAIEGNESVSSINLKDNLGTTKQLPVDIVLIRIGVEPNSELLKNKAELDENGYVTVNHLTQTTIPNTYAIGDMANPASPTISTAVGGGAEAAKTCTMLIEEKLV